MAAGDEIHSTGTVPQRADTERVLLVKAVQCCNDSSGGAGQIVAYTGTDPNSDAVVPADQTQPAIAVKPGASVYTWDTGSLTWVTFLVMLFAQL